MWLKLNNYHFIPHAIYETAIQSVASATTLFWS